MKIVLLLSICLSLFLFTASCSEVALTPESRSLEDSPSESTGNDTISSVDILSSVESSISSSSIVVSSSTQVTATVSGLPNIKAISLNIYAHASMPGAAGTYAGYLNGLDADVVGIQEGVNDWKIGTRMPTDYWAANSLADALGPCWEQQYQIYVNTCKGNSFVSNRRFDLTDGPNATRTGESAVITKEGKEYLFLTVHWDHESVSARAASAIETAAEINLFDLPTILVGDFNTGCISTDPNNMANLTGLSLIHNGGIDCLFQKGWITVTGDTFGASPSDHPGVWAELAHYQGSFDKHSHD